MGLTAQAIILSALRASSLLQSETDSKIRQTPGPSSRGLSLASASYLLHRRSQRSRRLLDRNSKGSTMLASNPKFRIQPLSRFAICHARYRLSAIGYLRSALRSDNDYGNWDRKKVGSRSVMFTWTGTSICAHSPFSIHKVRCTCSAL